VSYTSEILEAAKKVKILVSDIDGVMTAGEVIMLESGEEIKIWSVKDRFAYSALRNFMPDLKIVWITGRKSKQVELRAAELKIDFLVQACMDKKQALDEILSKLGFTYENVAFAGDDIIDIALLKACGVSICPKDAVPEAITVAKCVSVFAGGKGVIRELVEIIMKAQNKWQEVLEKYT
jgi:3-deoxy-D-manno-octulosonate 8-phosphate phosphatase (KDO 8-P phosphatase)